jgi:hypothetical protein
MSKKETQRSIGDIINQLSSRPKPFTLQVEDQEYHLFVHPGSDEIIKQAGELVVVGDSSTSSKCMDFLICHCIKDKDGNQVWQKPEDIKIASGTRIQLQKAINQHVYGMSVTEFAAKN